MMQPYPPKKKINTWRSLTDEQRWNRIYADREKRAQKVIDSLPEAVALALPPYAIFRALDDCAANNVAYVRADIQKAVVGSVALVAQRLVKTERPLLSTKLEHHFSDLKNTGFYLDAKEFMFCVSSAVVRLVDDGRYPADAPVTSACIMIVEDAATDEAGDWNLNQTHAAKMSGICVDNLILTGLYANLME